MTSSSILMQLLFKVYDQNTEQWVTRTSKSAKKGFSTKTVLRMIFQVKTSI